jgi:hypothetical protein
MVDIPLPAALHAIILEFVVRTVAAASAFDTGVLVLSVLADTLNKKEIKYLLPPHPCVQKCLSFPCSQSLAVDAAFGIL